MKKNGDCEFDPPSSWNVGGLPIRSGLSSPRPRLSVEDALEKLKIDAYDSPVIVSKVQSREIVIAGDLTTAVAGHAIVMPVPGQAQ